MTDFVYLYAIAAYLFGSIPFGLLIGKWVKRIDVRLFGSRNIGATNVARVIGKKWGFIVFILDVLKGFLGVSLPIFLSSAPSLNLLLFLSLCSILGHTFPVWLKFKGGKGVATSLGAFIAVSWQPTLAAFSIWIVCFLITHIISISSLLAAFCFPLLIFIFNRNSSGFGFFLTLSIFLCVFILYTHRENIKRLVQGTEKRLF